MTTLTRRLRCSELLVSSALGFPLLSGLNAPLPWRGFGGQFKHCQLAASFIASVLLRNLLFLNCFVSQQRALWSQTIRAVHPNQ
ncbi:hypothetical protein BDV12DRAFT_128422 [Aspergillus spectabilis]